MLILNFFKWILFSLVLIYLLWMNLRFRWKTKPPAKHAGEFSRFINLIKFLGLLAVAWFQHHVGAFLREFYECLYGSFVHSENTLGAACFEQRLRNKKEGFIHTSAKLFHGKRDTISDRAIVLPIVCSRLRDDRFALFLPLSRILCNHFGS